MLGEGNLLVVGQISRKRNFANHDVTLGTEEIKLKKVGGIVVDTIVCSQTTLDVVVDQDQHRVRFLGSFGCFQLEIDMAANNCST